MLQGCQLGRTNDTGPAWRSEHYALGAYWQYKEFCWTLCQAVCLLATMLEDSISFEAHNLQHHIDQLQNRMCLTHLKCSCCSNARGILFDMTIGTTTCSSK